MKTYEVPRRQVDVQIEFRDGVRLRGLLYAASEGPSGEPGRVSERLNDETEQFLPLVTPDGARMVNKRGIVVVVLRDEDGSERSVHDVPGGRRPRVVIHTLGGQVVRGELPYEMPPGKERLIDFLNESERFLMVFDEDRVALINRDTVISIESCGTQEP